MRQFTACAALALGLVATLAAAPRPDDRRAAEQHYKNGVELMQAESWAEAAAEFETAVSLDPVMVLAHYNLGQCRMALKRYPEAVTAYKGARDAFEQLGSLSEQEREARERERRDEIHELRDTLARVNQIKSAQPQHLVLRLEERIRVLEALHLKGAERRETPAEFPLALGSAYFRQGLLPDAEREYKEAVRLNKKLGPAHNNLAVIYLLTGRLAEAEDAVRQAEAAGFAVNPRFKDDLDKAQAAAAAKR